MFQWVLWAVHTVHDVAIMQPLKQLYFRGPLLHGWGFWGGAAPESVCAAMLPGSHTSFWQDHLGECEVLLHQRFDSFSIAVHIVVYILLLFKVLQGLVFHWLVVQPAIYRLECLLTRKNVFPTTWNPMPHKHVMTTGESSSHVTGDPAMFSNSKQTPPKSKYWTAQSSELE